MPIDAYEGKRRFKNDLRVVLPVPMAARQDACASGVYII